MEYRKLPKGNEVISALGLGMGGIQYSSDEEIEKTITKAIEMGINFFDLCCGGKNVYEPFGRAIKGKRSKLYLQIHFGATYNDKGEYGWTRDLDVIKKTLDFELQALGTDYIDFGFLHCVDDFDDLDKLISSGVLDYLIELKRKNVVRHIGFSSHTPEVAQKILDMGLVDLFMFSINAAYDYEQGDEYGIGSTVERASLFKRCEKEQIAISVMKPFHGGQLLDEKISPFRVKMTKNQCLQYCLDRPGVITVLPGIRGLSDLNEVLKFIDATKEEKDYSIISDFTSEKVAGNCVYCNHCEPCPQGLNIGLINKYYDLTIVGDKLAEEHYKKLLLKASDCIECGKCNNKCPFKVKQMEKMKKIAEYFGE